MWKGEIFMSVTNILISVFIGYALGCIQTAYAIGKLVGKIDIRQHGSNNAGASNVTSTLGWRYGIITAVIDILKAVLAVLIVKALFPNTLNLAFIAGTFAILGHIFPAYLKFKGGKGAASLIGMFLALDLKIAIILIITIIALTILIDYIAVASIAMFTTVPVAAYMRSYPMICVALGILLALVCYYKHYINIVRIIKGQELGLRNVARANKSKK